MAALLKKLLSVYDGIRIMEKAEATTQRDMARLARKLRQSSEAERRWRVNP